MMLFYMMQREQRYAGNAFATHKMTPNPPSDLARSLTGALNGEGPRDLAARLSPYLPDRDRSRRSLRDEGVLTPTGIAERQG